MRRSIQKDMLIKLTDTQFDCFVAICEDSERKPSKAILDAARRLDDDGLGFYGATKRSLNPTQQKTRLFKAG